MAPRISIVQLDVQTLTALAAADLPRAARLTSAPLSQWLISDAVISIWARRARQVLATPQDLPWVTGLVLDLDTQTTVGRAGFHGAPDSQGMVEVGYAIDPIHRRRGYARAALEAMLARALRRKSRYSGPRSRPATSLPSH